MDRRHAPLWVTLQIVGVIAALCARPAGAIPFSSATPPVLRQVLGANSRPCVLDISSRGITSIASTDLAPYVSATCSGGERISTITLANNSLSSLPTGVFAGFSTVSAISLALNAFNATDASIGNLLGGSNSAGCVLCPVSTFSAEVTLDLSFNALGPSVPPALRKSISGRAINLILWGVGLLDIQPNAFANATLATLDLSFNDLSAGLHPGSFDNRITSSPDFSVSDFWLILNNCRLRSSSLMAGVFDMGPYTLTKTSLSLSNWIAPIDPQTQYAYSPVAPNLDWDPLQRAFTKERFYPPGQPWAYNPPTPAQFDASWGNLFVDFPVGLFHSSIEGPQFQPQWYRIRIGEVVSLQPGFLGNALLTGAAGGAITISLAPNSVATAFIDAGTVSCPMASVAAALAWSTVNTSNGFDSLTIVAYDQPTSAECGAYATCIGCRTLFTAISFPVEPAFVEPAFSQWLSSLGAAVNRRKLGFTAPPLEMWSPRLNRSDWIDVNFFCNVGAGTLVMPALPFDATGTADVSFPSFPFPPPSGMLACMRDFQTLNGIEWTLNSLFPADLLVGLNPQSATPILLKLDLESLMDTSLPIPLAFFDALPAAVTVTTASCINSITPLCLRITSHCPYIVNGVCETCPPGFWKRVKSSLFYCSACPAGSFCNSTLSALQLPIPWSRSQPHTDTRDVTPTLQLSCCVRLSHLLCSCCPFALSPAGSFQANTGRSECSSCPPGTYNELTGRSDPASCLLCPPGSANPHFGGGLRPDACAPCPLGSASGSSGVAVCPACPGGSFADAPNSFACQLCPAGTYGAVPFGAISRDNCTACPGSAPASPVGSASIVQCATGVACPSGLWTAPGPTSVCASQCPVGSSCTGGVRTLCAAGSYQSQPGMGSCTPCGAGYVGATTGSSSVSDCMACPPSTYSSEAISTHCTPCDVGLASTGVAHASSHDCAPVLSCLTPQALAFAPTVDPTSHYCALMTTPFPLSSLLPGGLEQMQSYLQRCALIEEQANQTVTEVGGGLLPGDEAAFANLVLTNKYAAYSPVRQGPSLRLAAFGSDELLDASSAGAGAVSIDKAEGFDSGGSLTSSSITAILVSFLLIAFLPWALYRILPARVVTLLDQFNIAHKLRVGESVTKIPTQFGAVVSWSFLWVAMLVAILLATQSNTLTTVKLLPPSASNLAGSATASWELTVRVYAGQSRSEMAVWCAPDGGGLRARQLGFSEFFKVKAQIADASDERGSSCSIAATCASCGLTSSALSSLTFPFSAQLIEWEVWVSSAEPGSWVRRYGVLTQLPGRLLDIESRLSFTAIESFYSDDRSAAFSHSSAREEDKRRSGFELNFISFNLITPQNLSTYTPASTVTFSVSISKSDVLLQTALTDKQTPLQIVTLIASACVSLFSIFAITFRLVEAYVLKKCGISPGPISAKDHTGRRASILAAPANGSVQAPSDSIEMQISPNPAVAARAQQWTSGPSDADELGRL